MTHTLWISHMDAGQLLAFDVVHRRISKMISAPGVHGVIAVPQIGRVYASATNARDVMTIITASGQRIATIRLGGEAGNVQFDR